MLTRDTHVPDFALPDSTGKLVQYHSFLDKNRIVLVAVPGAAILQAEEYVAKARAEQTQFEERDTVLMMVVPEAGALAKQPSEHWLTVLHDPSGATLSALGATGSEPVSYLIGKDRGIKRTSAGFFPADAVFAAIDAMPMRRREMRERR